MTDQAADRADSDGWAEWLLGMVDAPDEDDSKWSDQHSPNHDDTAAWLLDLVAAVDHLARGPRPGLTIWDALDEALHQWISDHCLVHDGAPDPDAQDGALSEAEQADPLGHTLQQLASTLSRPDAPPAPMALDQALHRWVTAMATQHNENHHWPHPRPRRRYPPPSYGAKPGD